MSTPARVMLIVLDGWGVAPPSRRNAISQARTPTITSLTENYFTATLQASGIAVGLPWREEGNSEVGHMNMGAGHIVYQYLPRITEELRSGTFYQNPTFLEAIHHAKTYQSRLHVMGLFSSGNVHSSQEHFLGILDLAAREELTEVVTHLFTDGKDGKPHEAVDMLQPLMGRLAHFAYKIPGSIAGRTYALDRNGNWDLTKQTYEMLTKNVGAPASDPVSYLRDCYAKGYSDTDVPPVVFTQNEKPIPPIGANDAVIFFDFREDSVRQLARAFAAPTFDSFERVLPENLFVVSMTEYEQGLPTHVAYPPPVIDMPLTQLLSESGKRQLHVAETEKYAHVTYFFNGAHEKPYPGEDRIMVRSEGGPHYDSAPQMQAARIAKEVVARINDYDFYLINFANADMVAHTGNLPATIAGVEAIDQALNELVGAARAFHVTVVITADHGNAEDMMDPKTGLPKTNHTGNTVPFYVVGEGFEQRAKSFLHDMEPSGILADVAPTILRIMGLPQPPVMTGKSLL